MRGSLDFDSEPWPSISDSAKDLVRRMLERNVSQRLTAHEVLCGSISLPPLIADREDRLTEEEIPSLVPRCPLHFTSKVTMSALASCSDVKVNVV